MLPKWHILLGLIFSMILLSIGILGVYQSIIVFISSFMIDTDHYLWYVYRTKDFNHKRAVSWFYKLLDKTKNWSIKKKEKYEKPIFIFHNLCCFITLTILGVFISKIFYYILLGFLFHIILDYIDLVFIHKDRLYYKISLIYTLKTNKNKKSLFTI